MMYHQKASPKIWPKKNLPGFQRVMKSKNEKELMINTNSRRNLCAQNIYTNPESEENVLPPFPQPQSSSPFSFPVIVTLSTFCYILGKDDKWGRCGSRRRPMNSFSTANHKCLFLMLFLLHLFFFFCFSVFFFFQFYQLTKIIIEN